MLVESTSDLELGETAGFDLAVPGLLSGHEPQTERLGRSTRDRGETDVAQGLVDCSIRALVAVRLSSGQPGSHAPGKLSAERPTVCGILASTT